MTKKTIQTFFQDGLYKTSGTFGPTCTYPKGFNLNGTLSVYSTYQCDDTKQKFLQKNFYKNISNGLNNLSFNIYHDFYWTNVRSQALTGKFNIKGNKMYIKLFGYNEILGKICKQCCTFTLTSTGFVEQWYYLDNHRHYKLYLTVNNIKQ